MNDVKIIANYLPQFHQIPENDEWWGKGFTDWVTVKNAKSLYDGHIQPKTPLGNKYYSLDEIDSIKEQVELAKKYGVYGFAIYHYWFDSNTRLLTKPAELILENSDVDIHYLFLWDNSSWKRTWSNVKNANDWAPQYDQATSNDKKTGTGMLAEVIYGDKKEWKEHFEYLLPFFKDDRYIKIDGMPVFGFFHPQIDFSIIKDMADYWNELAISEGFPGMYCMTRDNYLNLNFRNKFRYSPFVPVDLKSYFCYKFKDIMARKKDNIRFYDYDKSWSEIIRKAGKSEKNTLLSGFVTFDDTPRRGKRGRVVIGASPEKFTKYLADLIKISKEQEKEYVFLTAWNEWGEGAYLEPDEENGYQYLEALKKAIEIGNN